MREDSGFLPSGDGGLRAAGGHSAGSGPAATRRAGSSRRRAVVTHLAVAVLAAGPATGGGTGNAEQQVVNKVEPGLVIVNTTMQYNGEAGPAPAW